MLDFASGIFKSLQVPQLSIDIAFDGESFYLLEFQAVYFGTKTLEYSEYYFYRGAAGWEIREETPELELVYVESIDRYIKQTVL